MKKSIKMVMMVMCVFFLLAGVSLASNNEVETWETSIIEYFHIEMHRYLKNPKLIKKEKNLYAAVVLEYKIPEGMTPGILRDMRFPENIVEKYIHLVSIENLKYFREGTKIGKEYLIAGEIIKGIIEFPIAINETIDRKLIDSQKQSQRIKEDSVSGKLILEYYPKILQPYLTNPKVNNIDNNIIASVSLNYKIPKGTTVKDLIEKCFPKDIIEKYVRRVNSNNLKLFANGTRVGREYLIAGEVINERLKYNIAVSSQ